MAGTHAEPLIPRNTKALSMHLGITSSEKTHWLEYSFRCDPATCMYVMLHPGNTSQSAGNRIVAILVQIRMYATCVWKCLQPKTEEGMRIRQANLLILPDSTCFQFRFTVVLWALSGLSVVIQWISCPSIFLLKSVSQISNSLREPVPSYPFWFWNQLLLASSDACWPFNWKTCWTISLCWHFPSHASFCISCSS